jgi:hypothetical protein
VPDGKRIKVEKQGDGKYQLLIDGAKPNEDTADYKVVLSTDGGDIDSSCHLTVKLPPVNKPKMLKGLTDKTVEVGQSCTFEVETTGDAPTAVKWYKGGLQVKESARIKIVCSKN